CLTTLPPPISTLFPYTTLFRSHANTLHWIRNTGDIQDGDLLLMDAGVEVDSLFTADVTRTVPVSGTFTEAQRKVYEAVLEAQERSEEHTSELQSRENLVCRLLL